MKRKILTVLLGCILVFTCIGCSDQIILNLAFGDRVGTYSGDVNEEGLPDGQGKFISKNDEGEKWTYEGEFENGHFEGEGRTTWENGQIEIGTYKDDVIVPMKGNELKALYSTPEKYKYHCVEIIGNVFTVPEYIENGVAFQLHADPENYGDNTIVLVPDKDFIINRDDYVKIIGLVDEPFEGENAFGAILKCPTIVAREYEVMDYQDAIAPTLKSKDVNQTQTQYGYSITVQKVEYAEKETRVYIRVDNQGSDEFTVYSFNTKLAQNGKQYQEQINYNADYPELQTGLLVGNWTEGIIAFPPLDDGPFTLVLEGTSYNWNEQVKPYTFNIE